MTMTYTHGYMVVVFEAPETIEDFEKFSYDLQMVSLSIIEEALKGIWVKSTLAGMP